MNSEAHVFPIPVSTSNIQAMAYQQLPSQCRHNLQLLWMTVDARILPSLLVLASVFGHGRRPADSRSTPQNIPDLNVSCLPTILHNCTRALLWPFLRSFPLYTMHTCKLLQLSYACTLCSCPSRCWIAANNQLQPQEDPTEPMRQPLQ